MNSVNKTLYIPLYGKAYVSKKGLFLQDPKAESIWESAEFPLKGKSSSKWLAYYMGIRAAVFDQWANEQMRAQEDAVIVHIGCGLDSRILRVDASDRIWYDVDFPEVIQERKQYFSESKHYHMIAGDAKDTTWLESISESKSAIVVMEGLSMYLALPELQQLMANLCDHFAQLSVLMDCYTVLSAKLSKYKNPINDVGVTQVYGLDDPKLVETNGLRFVEEHSMTPEQYINQLQGMEKTIFQKLYAGKTSKKLYRLYEYKKG